MESRGKPPGKDSWADSISKHHCLQTDIVTYVRIYGLRILISNKIHPNTRA